MPTDSSDFRYDAPDPARRLLLTLWLTISLTMVSLGFLVAILWSITPPLSLDRDFLSQFTPWEEFSGGLGYFYPYQPGKNLAFSGACLTSPFLIGLSYFVARRIIAKLRPVSPFVLYGWGLGISWLFFFWCLVPLFYCPNPPLSGMPPAWFFFTWFFKSHPLVTMPRLVWVFALEVLCLIFWRCRPTRKNLNIVLAVLVLGWMALAPTHLYAPVEVNEESPFVYHFNSIMDALSQVTNGHHWLVDFPHIYGGYIEFLGPVLLLFPRRIETVLLLFASLDALAVLGLLLTARRVIRRPLWLFLTGLALLGVEYIMSTGDHYYQYSVIRMVFPSLGLLSATLYLRSPTRLKYGAASLIAAVASIWNLDTGVVLWLSWTATLMVAGVSARGAVAALKHLARQVAGLVTVWIAFFSYLRLASGQWPEVGMLFSFQKIVLGSGYFCLRMIFPDIWMLVLTIYTIGLCVALVFYFQKITSWKTHFVLMLSLMGVGLFDYFMGRSAESNLVVVCYPAILLTGVFGDETQSLIARKKLPGMTWAFLLPAILVFLRWAVLFTMALPELTAKSADVLSKWKSRLASPIESNGVFVEKSTAPHEKVCLLSNQSGFYYYLSQTARPIKIPGTVELLRSGDINSLVGAINAEQFPKLLVDQNFYAMAMYRPDIYQQIQQAISHHYRAEATSPSGRVVLYLPR